MLGSKPELARAADLGDTVPRHDAPTGGLDEGRQAEQVLPRMELRLVGKHRRGDRREGNVQGRDVLGRQPGPARRLRLMRQPPRLRVALTEYIVRLRLEITVDRAAGDNVANELQRRDLRSCVEHRRVGAEGALEL